MSATVYPEVSASALEFMKYAVELRGKSYPRAERLIAKLTDDTSSESPTEVTKADKQKNLNGIEGWLALYAVGLVLTVILLAITTVGTIGSFKDLETIQLQNQSLYDSLSSEIWFEVGYHVLAIGLAIYGFVLLAMRKRLTKTVVIIYMLVLAVSSIIDYAWGSSLARTYNLDASSVSQDAAGTAGRDVLVTSSRCWKFGSPVECSRRSRHRSRISCTRISRSRLRPRDA